MKQNIYRIQLKKTLKLDYKINIRKAFSVIIPQFSVMLFSSRNKLSKLIDTVVSIIKNFKSAIRPNRKYDRVPNASRHSVYYRHNNLYFLS